MNILLKIIIGIIWLDLIASLIVSIIRLYESYSGKDGKVTKLFAKFAKEWLYE